MRHALLTPLVIGLAFMVSASPAEGAILEIRPDGSGPYPTLFVASAVAQPGDTLQLADGTFSGPENRNVVLGDKDLTIRSASGDPDLCIIDLEGDGRAFLIRSHPGTAVHIAAVTLRGGDPNQLPAELLAGYGGGLAVQGIAPAGSILLEQCVFEDGVAEAGGGAFVHEARATFLACTFRRNLATDGAGVYCGYCGAGEGVRFELCLFHGNDYPYPAVGGYGAGIYYSHSVGVVQSCTLAFNRAWLGAGLLVSTASHVAVAATLIAFSPEGQGLAVHAGTATASHCDIYGNAGGDWVGPIAGYLGIDCNVAADPIFCDAAADDFALRGDSPCLPEQSGGCGLIGALPQGCPDPMSAVGEDPRRPAGRGTVSVVPCPHPSHVPATITFAIAHAGRVRLGLYTPDGRHVATPIDGWWEAGEHRLASWRWLDDRGQALGAGLYFLRLESTSGQVSRAVVLTR